MFNNKLHIFTYRSRIYQSKLKLLAIFGQSRVSMCFTPVGCKYLSIPSQYLNRTFSDFFFNINHKTDMNINE